MTIGTLFYFILALALCGFVLYLINRFVPMELHIKKLLNWLVILTLVIFVILWIMDAFNIWSFMNVSLTNHSRYHHP